MIIDTYLAGMSAGVTAGILFFVARKDFDLPNGR